MKAHRTPYPLNTKDVIHSVEITLKAQLGPHCLAFGYRFLHFGNRSSVRILSRRQLSTSGYRPIAHFQTVLLREGKTLDTVRLGPLVPVSQWQVGTVVLEDTYVPPIRIKPGVLTTGSPYIPVSP